MNSHSTAAPPYETGVIHGRFQILHNDHLAYLLAGYELCNHLVVGITNPDPQLTRDDEADRKRSTVKANPLTYYERYLMVQAALISAGVPLSRFSIVPFPVNLPELYRYYVPMDAVFFLSIYDDWGRRKQGQFQKLGLKLHILRDVSPEDKGISAVDIRTRLLQGTPWQHLVPPAVADLIVRWDLAARLADMADAS
jgi:nicotinamide-nucleotide adenylyltransferase